MKNAKLYSMLFAAMLFGSLPTYAGAVSFDLSTVVERNTPIPDGMGTFGCLPGGAYSVSGTNVAFWGSGFQPPFFCRPSGIYLLDGGNLSKVADQNTAVPGKSENFTEFDFPVISGNSVAFAALGPGARQGIYLFAGATLRTVADQDTVIPDGTGTFTSFAGIPAGFDDGPVISGSNVAFFASGSGGGGIYLFNGSSLVRVVDRNTPIPPGGVGNFAGFGPVAISGDNVVFEGSGTAFGQPGIYLFDRTALGRVADTTTPIPGGTGHFVLFEGSPVINGNQVAFKGVGSNGQRGIYLFDGSTLDRVADTSTTVPEGTDTFADFRFPVIGAGGLAFLGISEDQREGIYLFNGTTLVKAADTSTLVPGGPGHFTDFRGPTIGDGIVAFSAQGSSGEQGIYVFNGTTLSVVADTKTTAPGGTANFTAFSTPPLISGGSVAFSARAGAREGLFLASSRPIGAAKVWLGLKNSDDVGLRVDVLAEVLRNDAVIASAVLSNETTGSSGFQHAKLKTVELDLTGEPAELGSGDTLALRLSVRKTCAGRGHTSGAVRVWYNGEPADAGRTKDAGSRVDVTVAGVNRDYFLHDGSTLDADPGPSRLFADVFVDSKRACPDRPFEHVGTWSVVLP